jgi:hypothetical protein
MANVVTRIWNHTWLWIDWHGRVSTVILLVVAAGGATLINRALTIWSSVSGVYLWVISGLVFAVFIATFAVAGSKMHPMTTPDKNRGIDVDLIPSKAQSTQQFLEVVNKGKKQMFTAQCRILERRNDPNPTPHILLDLAWWMRPSRKIEIATGESCNLLVAEAGDVKGRDGWVMEWIGVRGFDGNLHDSRFDRGTANLPEYDLEISVFGDASEKPYVAHFTLQPGTSRALEMIRKMEEIWEPAGDGGPQLLLNWDYPPEAKYSGLGITHKILTIENSSKTDDAFDVRLDTISLSETNKISASMRLIKRISAGEHVRPEIILSGKVPEGHQGELEMVYFAGEPLRREFSGIASGQQFVRFPIVLKFKSYSEVRYRAFFEFTDDLESFNPRQQVGFIRREKLAAMQPV